MSINRSPTIPYPCTVSDRQSVCSSLTVQRAILEIDSRGLDVEGIYRIPGKLGLIQQVVQAIEQDEFAFEFDPERHDVHTVAGVLKVRIYHYVFSQEHS